MNQPQVMGIACGNYLTQTLGQRPIESLPVHILTSDHAATRTPFPKDASWTLEWLDDVIISLPEESYFPRLRQEIWESLNQAVGTSQIVDGYRQLTGLYANAESGACCPFVFQPSSLSAHQNLAAHALIGSSPIPLNILWKKDHLSTEIDSVLNWLESQPEL